MQVYVYICFRKCNACKNSKPQGLDGSLRCELLKTDRAAVFQRKILLNLG